MTQDVELYSTTEIDLAAYLICKEHAFLRIEMQGTRGFFVFLRSDAIDFDVAEWNNETSRPHADVKLFAKKRTMLYRRVRDLLRAQEKTSR